MRTAVRAGGIKHNHNERLVRGMQVRTAVRAGGIKYNHNERLVRGL